MTNETTPQDDKAMPPASAGSQGPDITVRLRRWTHSVDAVFASDIMDEAAGVIEKLRRRLRLLDAAVRSQPTLTDKEQLAIAWAAREADEWDEEDTPEVAAHAEALRGLAKRLF
jgi:hypothetical protein